MLVALVVLLLAGTGQAAAAAPPAGGQLEKITIHGASLEGNLAGDSADRTVYVYLPAGYGKEKKRRYPVVYFLHGFGATAQQYVEFFGWPASLDAQFASGKLQDMILVLPDTMNTYGGSMYSSSPTIGDWEAFVARDVVGYVDGHYRTVARREARGLAGHSMGGYGTLRIGMKYPDVFIALYSMSACCLDPRGSGRGDADLEKLTAPAEVAKMTPFSRTTLAASASWAANVQRPPFYMDLPTSGGAAQADVLERYTANALTAMASQYSAQLRRYKAIAMDIGLQDGLIGGNAKLDQELTRLGVAHGYATYEGDHMNKVAGRFAEQVLPYFSAQLTAGKRQD